MPTIQHTESRAQAWVTVDVLDVPAATSKALLCLVADEDGVASKYWIPLSQVNRAASEVRGRGDRGRLVISAWLADQNDIPLAADDGPPDATLTLEALGAIHRRLLRRFAPERIGPDGTKALVGVEAFWAAITEEAGR